MGRILGEAAVWGTDVTILSALLALVEIVIEKDRGWASALSDRGWGRKLLEGSALARWIDKPYITSYHLLVFGALLPLALWAQYQAGWFAAFGLPRTHPVADGLFLVSAFLAVCILEDFLWFALNWYYPRSLADLLAGEIWWHTGWVALAGSVKLPRVYLSVGGIALCLLGASLVLSR